MNFLLKIVEGPNKGAEIALVDGVAVSFGKQDDCDIVLADATLPDEPMKILATSEKVTLNGNDLEQFHVTTVGATSFAVGPADSPWSALVWPKAEPDEKPEAAPAGDGAAEEPSREEPEPRSSEPAAEKRRGGWIGCLLVLIVLLLIATGLCWFFREAVMPVAESLWKRVLSGVAGEVAGKPDAHADGTGVVASESLDDIAARHGLSLGSTNGRTILSGNLSTRRERLAATAEAYAVQPGVELDLSDDESFRTAAEDSLFTLTEGALKVLCATNRVLAITGSVGSPAELKKAIEALNADLPKLKGVDVGGVRYSASAATAAASGNDGAADGGIARSLRPKKMTTFPVCGILTAPYPCLVMKNGMRVLEGAAIGDSVILKIEADSVTLTNSTGRFTWKP